MDTPDLESQFEHVAKNIVRLLTAVGERGTCRGCGREIWWVVHRNGKKAPYTSIGLNHFADCPEAQSFRKEYAGEDVV